MEETLDIDSRMHDIALIESSLLQLQQEQVSKAQYRCNPTQSCTYNDENSREEMIDYTYNQPANKKRKHNLKSSLFIHKFFGGLLRVVVGQFLMYLMHDYKSVGSLIQTTKLTSKKDLCQQIWRMYAIISFPALSYKYSCAKNIYRVDTCVRHVKIRSVLHNSRATTICAFKYLQSILKYGQINIGDTEDELEVDIVKCEFLDWEKLVNMLVIQSLIDNVCVCGKTFFKDQRSMSTFILNAPNAVGRNDWTNVDFLEALEVNLQEIDSNDTFTLRIEEHSCHEESDEFNATAVELKNYLDRYLCGVKMLDISCTSNSFLQSFATTARIISGVHRRGFFVGTLQISSRVYLHHKNRVESLTYP